MPIPWRLTDTALGQTITGALCIQQLANKGLDNLVIELKEKEADTPVTIIDRITARKMADFVLLINNTALIIDEELGNLGNADATDICYQDSCDGTSNLMFEPARILPVAGATWVSNGKTKVCAVADPILEKVLYCEEGKGAFIRDFLPIARPVQLNTVSTKGRAKNIVMFDALLNEHTRTAAGKMLEACGHEAQNMRTYASCLLHLWMLATGQAQIVMISAMSGFWDIGLHLACQQVGCRVTDIHGNDILGPSKECFGQYPFLLGTAPGINHDKLLEAAQSAFGREYAGFRGPDYGK